MTKEELINRLMASSADPQKTSLTVKGMIIGAVPVIIYLVKLNGVDLNQVSLVAFVDQMFAMVAELIIIAGMARKLWYMGQDLLKLK